MQRSTRMPINRHCMRLSAGKKYYTLKRYFLWIFGGIKFAHREQSELAYEHFSHKTPLLRQLKDVQMYLQYNKIENLKIAVKKVDGAMIFPGQTFSYWKLIGRPTKSKGYLKGMVLHSGTFKAGTGGGLCQLSNLIYWMTIHTPLTVVERHRHGYDVFPDANRTQPFGSGATCFYNYGDLMIRNDTSQVFQLKVEVSQHDLKGSWRSNLPLEFEYEVYEKQHTVQHEYWGGYTRHNLLFRKKYNMNRILLDDEYVVENHAIMMYAPFLES